MFNRLEALPLTDKEIAQKLRREYGEWVHYTSSDGWYNWNEKIHELDTTDTLGRKLVYNFIDQMDDEIQAVKDEYRKLPEEDRKKIEPLLTLVERTRNRISNNAGTRGLVSALQDVFRVPNDYFDKPGNFVAMADGSVIDLAMTFAFDEIVIKPADPKFRITRTLGTSIDAKTETDPALFLHYLSRAVPLQEDRDYLQEALGAALTGYGTAKNIPNLIGVPNTFKSTFINIMDSVFGEYAGPLPPNALMLKYGGGANFAQSQARGKRFLYVSEPQTSRTDDSFLKALAGGGDQVSTEHKGKDSVNWKPQCVLFIAANDIVKFDTRDNAIVQRMNIIHFENPVSEQEINPDLVNEILREEAPQILAWILEGARRFFDRGSIFVPETIKTRADEHVVESNPTLLWYRELLENEDIIVNKSASARTMWIENLAWQSFKNWCVENDYQVKRGDWRKSLNSYLQTPKEFIKTRPGGYARVYGVVPKVHQSGVKSAPQDMLRETES